MKSCDCCKKDESDNWIKNPCCDLYGVCDSDATDPKQTIANCVHCGGEMFKENGNWYHYSQKEIPENERGTIHLGI